MLKTAVDFSSLPETSSPSLTVAKISCQISNGGSFYKISDSDHSRSSEKLGTKRNSERFGLNVAYYPVC